MSAQTLKTCQKDQYWRKQKFLLIETTQVLNMVRNIDERLEEETLGRDKIIFTRGEYDSVAKTSGFENRFEKIGK